MFHNKTIALLVVLAGCALISAQIDVAKIEPKVIPLADEEQRHKTTTTTTSTSTTTTTTTTTTPAPPTTSSTTSTTTTMAPETTTASTSTTTTSTTTAAPITTTTNAPLPTTTAKPYPAPQIGMWNNSCIMVKMAAQLNFTYVTKDNKNASTLYNIPADAQVYDSDCTSAGSQMINVMWGPKEAVHSMTLRFEKNKTVTMHMINFNLPLNSDDIIDAKENQTIQLLHRGDEFSAPLKMSYHCTRSQLLNLTDTVIDTAIVGMLTVHDVQIEAFRTANTTNFSAVHDCDSSQTSDIVPIAVGIALVALILIVLTAYLCARRQSATRGYMSF